ncbi:uncharacterized protein LOC117290865 [Asterias rubens]|uniref:uncharacterized protein LOC117290865 n=1 Tax=Asterias rubens TaxID=7604 RepID=UPI001455BD0A|nr:uncharacterized protein LOC117290865 [Asterias rubens]
MQNQKKITQTFSSKKRSHQALIAHPNNESSSNARYQGSFGSSSSSNHGPAKQPRHTNNNRNQLRQPSFNNTLPRPSWNDNPNNNSAFFQPSFRGNPVPPLPQSPWMAPSPFAPGFEFEGGPSGDQAPRLPPGINNSWQKWAGVNEDQRPTPTRYPTQMMGMPQFGRDLPHQPNNNQDYPIHQQQPHFPVGRDPPPLPCWPPHQNSNRPPPNVGPPHQSAPPSLPRLKVDGKFSQMNQQGGFSVDDRSSKVLTASIADVRNWSKHTDKAGVFIFEVYGKMTSAMSSDINGLAKKFTLKDQNQTLKCIFYETDRPLVKLTKDQWLRCMGSLDGRSGLFRCVSVRPATPAEQKVMTTLITTSGSVMKERLASVQEP